MSWIMNLISGWLPLGVNSKGQNKSFGEWAGKIVWVVGIVLAVFFAISLTSNIMDKFFPPKPTVVNVAGDYNAEQKDLMGVGCSILRGYARLGVKGR